MTDHPLALPSVVIVTGTGTEVGKTIATAALACALAGRGTDVAAVKVAQTGVVPGETGDAGTVAALTAGLPSGSIPVEELLRLPDPLAPDTAARRAGVTLPPVAAHAKRVTELTAEHSVVLVEGSGGLLVRLDGQGRTLADLATALRYKGVSTGVVLVARAGLGTLNEAALTAEALERRQLPLIGVVIGDWPAEPGLAEECNVEDLPTVTGSRLLGRIPMGSGSLAPADFAAAAPGWLEGL
jgi:dethiobiotin synthetase